MGDASSELSGLSVLERDAKEEVCQKYGRPDMTDRRRHVWR